ncbi:TorD/DmsD family molecular chaperone [Salisediminibacterium beveridgei]|uniref:Putative oxidoreductase, TorD-like protein n=1 Tax=Salisediminibacterium beveridgei TaxID=632773 RepID=A0A1D7QX82_9BACI|nr:molecular chaperone TorD family protein [Salisediminibacterium beveridgei]AOM83617.1 Putative oxidoreductase, TorD-like protein [Salisediminibacterium beveridgei]
MKVHQDPIFNVAQAEDKKKAYMIFSAYYHNQLWNQEELQLAIDMLRDFAVTEELAIEADLKILEQSSNDQLKSAVFDFTKLFIGPDQLKVPPYESVYVNQDRLIMAESTLKVRRFYEMCGVEINGKGKFPEDHIAFELEFMSYLYHRALADHQERRRIRQFLKAHLSKWYEAHLTEVEEQAETEICRAWASIMRQVIEKDISDAENEWKGGS